MYGNVQSSSLLVLKRFEQKLLTLCVLRKLVLFPSAVRRTWS